MVRPRAVRPYLILILLVAGVGAFYSGRDYLTFSYWKQNLDAAQSVVAKDPLLWGAVYFGVYVFATALSIPTGFLLTLLGGAFFGFWWGLLLTTFASTIGADIAFLLTRMFFADAVRNRFADTFEKVDSALRREGAFYLFAMRIHPIFPFFLTNWVMGLTAMTLWEYHWISQIGMLVPTAIYVNTGVQLGKLESLDGLLSLPLILSLTVLGLFPLVVKRLYDRRERKQSLAKAPYDLRSPLRKPAA